VEPTETWSYGKKRTWEDFFYGDDPHYQEHVDREDEELQEYLYWKEEEQRQADKDSGYTDFLEEGEQEKQDARAEAHQEYLDVMDVHQQDDGNDDDGHDDYIRQQNQGQWDLDAEVDQAYVDMMNERHEDTGYEDHLEEQEQEQHNLDVEADQDYLRMMNEQQRDNVDLNNVNIGEQGEVKPFNDDEQILRCDGGHQEDLDLPDVQKGTRGLDVAQQDIFASAQNPTQ
jgi:hypothetical protein